MVALMDEAVVEKLRELRGEVEGEEDWERRRW